MYIPSVNKITDQQEAIGFMQRYSFATLVTVSNGIPSATHLPFLVTLRGKEVILSSHFAKANPQASEILEGNPLVIFTEPHAYISPKHYEQVNSVPTWNYIAVHAYGKATLLESVEKKVALLEQTIRFYEAEYFGQCENLPNDFKLKMMQGIVGFEIVVSDLQGKKKLSQNKSEKERDKIIEELGNQGDTTSQEIADYMKALRK
jgi:transcriptional regulator